MLTPIESRHYPWLLRLDAGTLNPLDLALHPRMLLYAPASPTTQDNLELLAVMGAKGQHLLLLNHVPPVPLLRALAAQLAIGVYLPNDAPLCTTNTLGIPVALKEQLDVLRKLHVLLGTVTVLADASAMQDAHHYQELVGVGSTVVVYL